MNFRFILFLILGIDALILFSQTSSLSISYAEAMVLYGDVSFLQLLIKASLYLFGSNDFALRLPMITMHILSSILLYKISKKYLINRKSRLWLVLVFVLLPGVISSAIIVNTAGLIIFCLFIFVYAYEKLSKKYIYLILTLYFFMGGEFVYLFFAMSVYAIYTSQRSFFLFNMFAFFASLFVYGVDTKGVPKGHFLDAIAIYSAIFTPLIFIYIFYSLYRRYLSKELDVLWFISAVTLVLSLLISFRQRIELEQFAPYLILALPLAAQTFYRSYRVRLKMFRTNYKIIFIVSLLLLFLNSLVVFFNNEIYIFIDNPKNHFAYDMNVAKELAKKLKDRNINCVDSDRKMSVRLKFYGIDYCKSIKLVENTKKDKILTNIIISYKNRDVYFGSIIKNDIH